jgi:hypothetical protein
MSDETWYECEEVGCPPVDGPLAPGEPCPVCGGPTVEVGPGTPASYVSTGLFTVAEVDQLQAEAEATGRSLDEVVLADTFMDMELGAILRDDGRGAP